MTQVLLVENDPTMRAGMRISLEAEGYSVSAVADGAAALNALMERFWPQVVLVGQLTPDLSLAALLRAASEVVDLRRHAFMVMESAPPDPTADMMSQVCEDLEVLVVERFAYGCPAYSDACDDYERCEFFETLTEASRYVEAI